MFFLYFEFVINFDLIKIQTSNFNENICLDEIYNFGVELRVEI